MPETRSKFRSQKTVKLNLDELAELIASIDQLRPRFDLLKRTAASEYLVSRGATNYTSKALANLASRGQGPPYLKLGNDTYYLEHDLDAWILQQRIVPAGFYHDKEVSR